LAQRNKALGRSGEQIARAFLERQGYTFVAGNVRTPYGELDLIMRQNDVWVFVEVKTRSSSQFGLPEEAVNERKRTHIIQSSEAYLQEHPECSGDWRIDVIAIETGRHGQAPHLEWFENAIF